MRIYRAFTYDSSLSLTHSNARWFIALSSAPSIAVPAGYSTQTSAVATDVPLIDISAVTEGWIIPRRHALHTF